MISKYYSPSTSQRQKHTSKVSFSTIIMKKPEVPGHGVLQKYSHLSVDALIPALVVQSLVATDWLSGP